MQMKLGDEQKEPAAEMPGMKLLTKALLKKLPALRGQEGKGDQAIAHVKLFTPMSNWTWYVTEIDHETGECFGLVDGFEKEWGYFMLSELAELSGPMGPMVERDRWWKPVPVADVLNL